MERFKAASDADLSQRPHERASDTLALKIVPDRDAQFGFGLVCPRVIARDSRKTPPPALA